MLAAAVIVVARFLRSGRPGIVAAPPGGPDDLPDGSQTGDSDLTLVRGIGPVFRDRLAAAGILGPTDLAGADPVQVAAAAGVAEGRARDWIEQAAALRRR
jgi:predicted flap endonuclease-1-like 5' DNA nuclease